MCIYAISRNTCCWVTLTHTYYIPTYILFCILILINTITNQKYYFRLPITKIDSEPWSDLSHHYFLNDCATNLTWPPSFFCVDSASAKAKIDLSKSQPSSITFAPQCKQRRFFSLSRSGSDSKIIVFRTISCAGFGVISKYTEWI